MFVQTNEAACDGYVGDGDLLNLSIADGVMFFPLQLFLVQRSYALKFRPLQSGVFAMQAQMHLWVSIGSSFDNAGVVMRSLR